LKYSLDVFNLTNTASYDITIDDITQNPSFNGFPKEGTPAVKPGGGCNNSFDQSVALYVCPGLSGLGVTNKTIGSPRQIQMSLSLSFSRSQAGCKSSGHKVPPLLSPFRNIQLARAYGDRQDFYCRSLEAALEVSCGLEDFAFHLSRGK